MRVLFLTDYFPMPTNLTMGTWALAQARGIAQQVDALKVISPTSYVPRWLGRSGGAKAFAQCPSHATVEGIAVTYPRWAYYPVAPIRRRTQANPRLEMKLAWRTIRARLQKQVKAFAPDVLFVHHTLPNGYMAHRLKKQLGIPYVITDHDFGVIRDCETMPRRRELFREIKADCSMTVTVARAMEDDVRRLFPDVAVTTVHNGIHPHDPAIWSTPRPEALNRKKIVLAACMFYERKGLSILVEAFAKAARNHPDAVLRIIGDGEKRPEVEAAIAKSGMADRIELCGLQPRATVVQEMAWADVFALVGWDEPFATVFIEAMGAGTPIITCNDGGINDVVEDGVHGRSIPPRDVEAAAGAIDDLLTHDEKREQMGGAAKAMVDERLTWEANAKRMVELFEDAGERGKGKGERGEPHRNSRTRSGGLSGRVHCPLTTGR